MKQLSLIIIMLIVSLLLSCTPTPEPSPPAEVGTLRLVANGEDFVRQGFVSKDGWRIDFEHVYITLSDIAAYQTDPPFDAARGQPPNGESVGPAESYTIDLAMGDETAPPITISTLSNAPAGQYNALSWHIVPAPPTEPELAGYSIVLAGFAQKEGEQVEFTLKLPRSYTYYCGEYVGETRKGILTPAGETELEATFHFDHLFGDADAPMEEALNQGALGFAPLAALAKAGQLDIDMAGLETALTPAELAALEQTLATLGHVGEGHCYEATGGGYTGAAME